MASELLIPDVLSQGNLYACALMVAAVVNVVLAFMLVFDSNNYLYAETPRYLRSRRLTGAALAVFGVGFLLHWWFMPHFTNLQLGKALSFTYFHIGGVLFSLSHTGLIDRHYYSRRIVMRDVVVLAFSLSMYWINAFAGNLVLTYVSSLLFFVHISYMTWVFYSRFWHIYKQLGSYADYKPNDTDHEVLWLHYSCHLIICFGIGGMVCTVAFHDTTMPFTILLMAGVAVFTYIYKSLDSFGVVAYEAEGNLERSEDYVQMSSAEDGEETESTDDVNEVKERVERWVRERHYTDATLTIKDALEQMAVTERALSYYLEVYTQTKGYRQWLSYLRVEEAKRLMVEHPDYSFQAIAEMCGYSSNSTLSRSFKMLEGMPPVEWLKKEE